MYRLYSHNTHRKTSGRNRERWFFSRETIRRALVVLRSVIYWLRELWSVTIEWIEFGVVYKLYSLNQIVLTMCLSNCNRNRFDSLQLCQYTVGRRQYYRLSQQQQSLIFWRVATLSLSLLSAVTSAYYFPPLRFCMLFSCPASSAAPPSRASKAIFMDDEAMKGSCHLPQRKQL